MGRCHGANWRPEFRLVAPDFPGFGESEKPPTSRFSYDVDSFAEVVADLYAGLDLGRAAVVGHATRAARLPSRSPRGIPSSYLA